MILITGGAGFLGSNIAARLCADGHDVAIADRLGHGDKWRNVAKRPVTDIVAPEDTLDWIARHGDDLVAVVHMGGGASSAGTDVDLILSRTNHLSRAVWDLCASANIPFIYASSAATYGDGVSGFDDDPAPQALARQRPLDPQGWSRLLFDRFVARQVARRLPSPPQHVGLRFFDVYGPNEYHKGGGQSVPGRMYEAVARGRPVTLHPLHDPARGANVCKRDFTYVKDCADVVSWLVEHPDVNGLFNIGTGKARGFADVAKALYSALGREPAISFLDTPDAIPVLHANEARIERLRAAGYTRPFTSLEAGIADYCQTHLLQPDRYL